MEFTGERYVPTVHGDIELEHMHRYLLVEHLVTGKLVLDIACGEGYGSALLSRSARRVIGVDNAQDAIQSARMAYVAQNLDFMVGSCTDIPLEGSSVDVVVSFETIEHLTEHERMMEEIVRVLRPDGILVMSSPDKYNYSIETGYTNPYHRKELYAHEFRELVLRHFKTCEFYGQRITYGSSIVPEVPLPFRWFWREGNSYRLLDGPSRPTYWLVVASNSGQPCLPASILEQPVESSQIVEQLSAALSIMEARVTELERDLADLAAAEEQRSIALASARAEAEARADDLQRAADIARARADDLSGRLSDLEDLLCAYRDEVTRCGDVIRNRDQQIASLRETIVGLNRTVQALDANRQELVRLRATRIVMLRDAIKFDHGIKRKMARSCRILLSFVLPGIREDLASSALRGDLGRERGTSTAPATELFDADLYLDLYPDIAESGVDAFEHYIMHGAVEGRIGYLPPLLENRVSARIVDGRETVLIVSHEGSRTGAPILTYNLVINLLEDYNVLVLFLGAGGPVLDYCADAGALVFGPIGGAWRGPLSEAYVSRILSQWSVSFVVVNSIESRFVLPALARAFVPSVSLIHEFAAYTRPTGAFYDAVLWSGRVAFSADVTLDNAKAVYPGLSDVELEVIPQGRCALPMGSISRSRILRATGSGLTAGFPEDALLVVGMGSVEYRKGVDLFLACAAKVYQRLSTDRVRFVWVGHGFDPETDISFSAFLKDQLERSGLAGFVSFVGAVEDLEEVYQKAHVLLLTSRLDPLPNVAIDALSEGIPVLCFDTATGIASILKDNGLGERCVCAYLDVNDMAGKLVALLSDPSSLATVGELSRAVAQSTFSMPRYVEAVRSLAMSQRDGVVQERLDCSTIIDDGTFRLDFYGADGRDALNLERAVRRYVRQWATGVRRRKPTPSFHPGIYSEVRGLTPDGGDPFADYLRSGRPVGPWDFPLITEESPCGVSKQLLRVALHIHVFYVDLVPDILARLQVNASRVDIYFSSPSKDDLDVCSSLFREYTHGSVQCRLVPNKGRDIGPFIVEYIPELADRYDVLGHIHTKSSLHWDLQNATSWRSFLLENLVGGKTPMMDRILERMATDNRIGMVFPSDPNVVGWGENDAAAKVLAKRLRVADLPREIEFPVGNMFWATGSALRRVREAEITWDELPPEPVPYDGTLLHALERLIPVAASAEGKQIVLTNVRGVTR